MFNGSSVSGQSRIARACLHGAVSVLEKGLEAPIIILLSGKNTLVC